MQPSRSNGAPNLSIPQNMMRDWAESRLTPFGLKIPKFAVPVTALGYAQPAVYGDQVLLCQYQFKAGWYGIITGLVVGFQGSGPAPLPGDVSWAVDIDRPLGATSGYSEKDYGAVPFSLGDLVNGPVWPVEFRHSNGETIYLKGTPVANVGLGAGQWFVGAMVGFEWPEQGIEGF